MKKQTLTSIISIIMIASAAAESSNSHFYAFGNASFPVFSRTADQHIYNSPSFSPGGGFGVGYRLRNNFGVELEAMFLNLPSTTTYTGTGPNEMSFTSKAIFLSGAFYPEVDIRLKPYLSAGVGYSRNSTSDMISLHFGGSLLKGASNNNAVFKASIGAAYPLSSNVGLKFDLKYLYLNRFTSVDICILPGCSGIITTKAHIIAIDTGIKFTF